MTSYLPQFVLIGCKPYMINRFTSHYHLSGFLFSLTKLVRLSEHNVTRCYFKRF